MADRGTRRGAGAGLSVAEDAGGPSDGETLWIAQHAIDQDILVFDSAESDASAPLLSFYSLTQFRKRTFSRSLVGKSIVEVTDDVRCARAKKDYARRDALLAAHRSEQETERAARDERQRELVLELHKKYLGSVDVEYQGVHEEPQTRKRSRRSVCHACKIALDDFAGVVCGVCDGVLCSCGACGCGSPIRTR
jgi:hypothetical protein